MNGENENNIPKDKEDVPNIQRESWEVKEIAEEGTNENSDDLVRKVLRDDENKNQGDKQDIVGSVDPNETPQGRIENKKDEGDKG